MRRAWGPRRVFWASLEPAGKEVCSFRREGRGWALRGSLVQSLRGGMACATYLIGTDSLWKSKRLEAVVLQGGTVAKVSLETKGGSWVVNGRPAPRLEGCADVDLEASPSTNTLAVRRLRLRVGSKRAARATWVRFPSLDVEPLEQSYERVGSRRYVYRSGTGYEAELETDSFGLVRKYGPWVAL